MSTPRIGRACGVVCGVGLLCAAAGSALGQDRSPEPPLRGPRASAPEQGERPGRFGERPGQPGREQAARAQAGSMGVLGRVLRVLGSERVDPSIRLNEEQITKLKALGKDYHQQQAKHLDTKRAEIAGVLERLDRGEIAQRVRDGSVTPDKLVGVVERLQREIVGGGDRPRGLDLGRAGGRAGDRPNNRPSDRLGDRPDEMDAMLDEPADRPARVRDRARAGERASERPRRAGRAGADEGAAGQTRRGALRERLSEDQRLALRDLMAIRRDGPKAQALAKQLRSILSKDQQAFVEKAMKSALADRRGEDRAGGRGADERRGRRGTRRPPPSMDEVDVPSPNEASPDPDGPG